MTRRQELHKILCSIVGSENVYFQPPDSVAMKYPAIRYSLSDVKNESANNNTYIQTRFYNVIVIDKNPDSIISDKISKLVNCRFDRAYSANNLNHYAYTIYY